jgi:DNA helicase-2/ATP-dependent DNA helicase PcrA
VPTLLDGLTEPQREAVTHTRGPLAIAGGPGTGKTRCVLARFAWLVERGAAPERLLLLAGSSPAADALRARL